MRWELSPYFSTCVKCCFPGSIVRSGLHSSPFLTVSGMWFLLVRLACLAILTGLWCRLSNSLPWVCLRLFPLRGVARPGHGLGSISQSERDLCLGLCQGLVVHLMALVKRPYLESGNEAHPSGKESAGGSVSTSSADTRMKRGQWGSVHSWYVVTVLSLLIIFICRFFQVGLLFKFLDQWRSITSNRIVFNMVCGSPSSA